MPRFYTTSLFKLYRCYAEEEKAPSVKFLWNSQFLGNSSYSKAGHGDVLSYIELLVQTLFKPGSAVNPEHKDKYLFLLAYAASVYENNDEVSIL